MENFYEKKLVNSKELAEYLNVKKSWIYQRTQECGKKFPYYRLGRTLRFDKKEVLEYFKNNK